MCVYICEGRLVMVTAVFLSLYSLCLVGGPRPNGVGDEKGREYVGRLLYYTPDRVGQARLDELGERPLLIRRQAEPDLIAHVRKVSKSFAHSSIRVDLSKVESI